MAVYKELKTNTWRVLYRYTDWNGERKQSQKRGFQTKREAQAWEREQLNKRPPLIDGLLYSGVYLFVGAPKLGKSFLMAQLAYHVSTGTPLWDYTVRKGTVLYLALEDDYRRLQERLYRMFGTDGADDLFFTVSAGQLNDGLDEQLSSFMESHPETRLIIIDTLQKIRETGGDAYSYANDYQVIAKLKQFTDERGICLLLVHHTRKQTADDKFDMISGTNGLLGAADGAFLLCKEKRTSNNAALDVSGRDQQDQRLHLTRNAETLAWELTETETELWKEPPEPLLEKVSKFLSSGSNEWAGTPTRLVKKVLARCFEALDNYHRLNVDNGRLYRENERLSKTNVRLTDENEILRAENRDYKLLRKVFGSRQIDGLLEQAKQSKQRDKRFRNHNFER